MAKISRINRNNRVKATVEKYAEKRAELSKIVHDRSISMKERSVAQSKLAALPRDSSKTRFRNRCVITGSPRAFYREFGMSRSALRKCARECMLPGIIKDSV